LAYQKVLAINVDTVKIELIDWITRLKDPQLIEKLLEFNQKVTERKAETKVYWKSHSK
jgi:hypothetical protein